jgi:hypothetical protein
MRVPRITPPENCFQQFRWLNLTRGGASPLPVASPPLRRKQQRKPCPFPHHSAYGALSCVIYGRCAHDRERQHGADAREA